MEDKKYITLEEFVLDFSTNFKKNYANIYYYIECDLIEINKYGEIHYLTLYQKNKDKGIKVKAVIYSYYYDNMNIKIEDLKTKRVNIIAKPHYQDANGTLLLSITHIELSGLAKVKEEFDRVYKIFEKKGAFLDENKVKLPDKRLVKTIALITKENSDGYFDMLNSIKIRNPFIKIINYFCSVQGKDAPSSIKESIEQCNRDKIADVILLGRGGGDKIDLDAYNHFDVVEAIYNSKIPIVTTIGHTKDKHIADMVSSFSAPVPAKGCDHIVYSIDDFKKDFEIVENINKNYFSSLIGKYNNSLLVLVNNLSENSPYKKISIEKEKIYSLEKESYDSVLDKININKNIFIKANNYFNENNPILMFNNQVNEFNNFSKFINEFPNYFIDKNNKVNELNTKELKNIQETIDFIIKQKINNFNRNFNKFNDYLNNYNLDKKINDAKQKLVEFDSIFMQFINNYLYVKKGAIINYYNLIENLDFNKIIKRGFSLIYKDQELIKSVKQLNNDDQILITLSDGKIKAKVIK